MTQSLVNTQDIKRLLAKISEPPRTVCGFPLIVSDKVPEGEVWMLGERQVFKFTLKDTK